MELIMKAPFGAHLYGLERPESDTDYRGIFIPDMDEFLLGRSKTEVNQSTGDSNSKNTKEDVDVNLYRLDYWIKKASQGDTGFLDMLHTPEDILLVDSDEWMFIRDHRARFYTKNMTAFVEYARHQAAKYGVKGSRMAALEEVALFCWNEILPKLCGRNLRLSDWWHSLPTGDFCSFINIPQEGKPDQHFYEVLGSKFQDRMPADKFCSAIIDKWSEYGERARLAKENNGIDWKALSHACRAAYQLKDLFTIGDIIFPFEGDRKKFLMDVKLGKLDFLTEVQPELERAIGEVEILHVNSTLPEEVDMSFWDDFILGTYKNYITL